MSDSRATCVSMQEAPHWEHFPHDADLGVRGIGRTREQAFEQAALAMTAAITDPDLIERTRCIDIEVHSTDAEILLTVWLNAIVFEMATEHLLFSRFEVSIEDTRLTAKAEGEPVEVARHHPAVEVKGATFTELKVERRPDGSWLAQCVVDVCKMDLGKLIQVTEYEWHIEPKGRMRVPGVIYAGRSLVEAMDEKVYKQVVNVACLPGIVTASYAMPDAHWGYGFPIGGVAAFDPDRGGVISAGGVGFDISCGVRTLHTGVARADLEPIKAKLAETLFNRIPAGMGSTGTIRLAGLEMDAMLKGGARWAVEQGWGKPEDLDRIEEFGCMAGAEPRHVSMQAKKRQRDEMGTLGSGNHYLEVQHVAHIFDERIAAAFGIEGGDILASIHCGSRGLGHQIGTEYLRDMALEANQHGITLPDRELACAPIHSQTGQAYLGAMRSAINCALANRQILTHLTRQAFAALMPAANLTLLYDVSHNTCKLETHDVEGTPRKLYVHRKGATRAFGPGHPDLPAALRETGQPVLIGGSMGTASYILCGTTQSEHAAFSSACHGAGRSMSRHEALRRYQGRGVVDDLARRGILIRSPSMRGVAEEAPGAYKDVSAVCEAAERAGLARLVARLEPLVCIKG